MRYILLLFTLIFILTGCDEDSNGGNETPCDPNPCQSGAICEVVGDTYNCKQADPCTPDPCGLNATCTITGEATHTCDCDNGYEMVQYECKLKLTTCDPDPCTDQVNTYCKMITGNKAACLCKDGFELVQVDPYNRICAGSDPCDVDPCKDDPAGSFCHPIDTLHYTCYDIPSQSSHINTLYSSLGDSKDEELINKLYNLVKDHHALGYKSASSKMYDIDTKNGKITCAYSNRESNGSGGLNPEHVWPQSYFGEATPMKSDLHHLFSVTAFVNSKRGNQHFGEVATTSCECLTPDESWYCTWQDTESSARKGPADADKCDKTSQYLFEPVDNIKGDVARALFYFAVRYKDENINQSQNPGLSEGDPVLKKGNRILITVEQTLRTWHWADPVDQREIDRNNAIQNIQNNRNPFIDRPDLVDRIKNF